MNPLHRGSPLHRGCGVPPQASSHRGCGVPPQAVPPASRRVPQPLLFLLLSLTLILPASAQTPTQRVGLPITLTDLYIPGGVAQLKPRPNREPPLVLRLLETKPAADGLRYDLEIYGLEPGTYNVADYLEPLDPANPPRFPEIPLTITTALPPGLPKPTELVSTPPNRVGGYLVIALLLAVLWITILLVLLFAKRSRHAARSSINAPPPTIAERLHQLLTAASAGTLDTAQKASLERLILGHWKQKLPDLKDLPPAEALTRLRHHPQAAPLLLQLEHWLHGRDSSPSKNEIDKLLAPYRA